jgi:hypothetical protein
MGWPKTLFYGGTNDDSGNLCDSAAKQVLSPAVSIAKEPTTAVLGYLEEGASTIELERPASACCRPESHIWIGGLEY